MTALPDETKATLLEVLSHAASQDRAVIEFQKKDDSLHAAEITEHVNRLEENQ
jgi:hypothetical protein